MKMERKLQQNPTVRQIIKIESDITTTSSTRRQKLEEYLLALLLHIPKDHIFVPNFPETLFTTERLRQVFVALVLYLDSISFKAKSFNINEFMQDVPKEIEDEIDKLYLLQLDEKLILKKAWQKEVDVVVSELKKALVKASLQRLSFEIRNAQEFGRMEILESLNKRFRDLSVKLKSL